VSIWVDLLASELELVELNPGNPFEPMVDVNPDRDHVVGEVSDELRRLYLTAIRWIKTSMEINVEANFTQDTQQAERLAIKAHELQEKGKILRNIFWAALKDEHKMWNKPSVGLRSGWIAVWSEPETPHIIGFLEDLFGGDD